MTTSAELNFLQARSFCAVYIAVNREKFRTQIEMCLDPDRFVNLSEKVIEGIRAAMGDQLAEFYASSPLPKRRAEYLERNIHRLKSRPCETPTPTPSEEDPDA